MSSRSLPPLSFILRSFVRSPSSQREYLAWPDLTINLNVPSSAAAACAFVFVRFSISSPGAALWHPRDVCVVCVGGGWALQLNMYNFRKVVQDPNSGEFRHDLFRQVRCDVKPLGSAGFLSCLFWLTFVRSFVVRVWFSPSHPNPIP